MLICLPLLHRLEEAEDGIQKSADRKDDEEEIACHGGEKEPDKKDSGIFLLQYSFDAQECQRQEGDGIDEVEPEIAEAIAAEAEAQCAETTILVGQGEGGKIPIEKHSGQDEFRDEHEALKIEEPIPREWEQDEEEGVEEIIEGVSADIVYAQKRRSVPKRKFSGLEKMVPVIIAVEDEGHLLESVVSSKRDGHVVDDPAVSEAKKTDDDQGIKCLESFGGMEKSVFNSRPETGEGFFHTKVEDVSGKAVFTHF